MESDEEPMEEPPPEYFQMRRRSNTLPKDFLSKLQPRIVVHSHTPPEEEADKPRNSSRLSYRELQSKSNNLALENGQDNSNRGEVCQSARSSRTNDKINGKATPKTMDDIFASIVNEKKRADLQKTTKYRQPLPRGSSLYEACLQEFGREEEERDLISPLPSPNQKRRKHRTKSAEVHEHLYSDSGNISSASPKFVHWS